MNARYGIPLSFKEPELPANPYGYRDPGTLMRRPVCIKCKREVTRHAFRVKDGSLIETHHCQVHGDVPSMQSHIANPH